MNAVEAGERILAFIDSYETERRIARAELSEVATDLAIGTDHLGALVYRVARAEAILSVVSHIPQIALNMDTDLVGAANWALDNARDEVLRSGVDDGWSNAASSPRNALNRVSYDARRELVAGTAFVGGLRRILQEAD